MLSVFLKTQNMIIEPFAFNEKHVKLFMLFLIKSFLNYFAFIDFTDLMFTLQSRSLTSSFNSSSFSV